MPQGTPNVRQQDARVRHQLLEDDLHTLIAAQSAARLNQRFFPSPFLPAGLDPERQSGRLLSSIPIAVNIIRMKARPRRMVMNDPMGLLSAHSDPGLAVNFPWAASFPFSRRAGRLLRFGDRCPPAGLFRPEFVPSGEIPRLPPVSFLPRAPGNGAQPPQIPCGRPQVDEEGDQQHRAQEHGGQAWYFGIHGGSDHAHPSPNPPASHPGFPEFPATGFP